METLGKTLIEKQLSISSVESFTVGGFAEKIGSIPGISAVYRGSAVTYQSWIKEKLLGIPHALVLEYGVVSSEVALAMAKAGQQIFESDICISFTGNSGPLPMENKPVGLCYIGLVIHQKALVHSLSLNGTRDEIKNQAIAFGIQWIKEELQKEEEK